MRAGVLNHKYAGEVAVRRSGVPYTVVRSVGLTTDDEDTPFLLETRQVFTTVNLVSYILHGWYCQRASHCHSILRSRVTLVPELPNSFYSKVNSLKGLRCTFARSRQCLR